MRKKPLQVTLHARQPSVVELTVGDHVQVDRLIPAGHGVLAARVGAVLRPGAHRVALDPGLYFFQTLSAAHLRVVHGGVDAEIPPERGKDPWPHVTSEPPQTPAGRGDERTGEAPELTVE